MVTNGGFETGDFTGWTTNTPNGGNEISTGDYAHSGHYGVAYGAVGYLDDLSQVLSTTPGDTESITFWQRQLAGTPNEFLAQFGNTTLIDLVNNPYSGSSSSSPWTEYSFTETATSSSTLLNFGLRQDPGYSALDDISVLQSAPSASPAPEPSEIGMLALIGLGLGGLLLRARRRVQTAA